MDAGVLANVESLQVQAVGADLHQQRIDQHLGEAMTAILHQRVAKDGQVGQKIGRAACRVSVRDWREPERRTAAWRPGAS